MSAGPLGRNVHLRLWADVQAARVMYPIAAPAAAWTAAWGGSGTEGKAQL